MNVAKSLLDPRVVSCLTGGGIVVSRTDTLYGVLARADDEAAVARVYALKDRSEHKSPIVLVSDHDQLHDTPPAATIELMNEKWPGPVSISPTTRATVAPTRK